MTQYLATAALVIAAPIAYLKVPSFRQSVDKTVDSAIDAVFGAASDVRQYYRDLTAKPDNHVVQVFMYRQDQKTDITSLFNQLANSNNLDQLLTEDHQFDRIEVHYLYKNTPYRAIYTQDNDNINFPVYQASEEQKLCNRKNILAATYFDSQLGQETDITHILRQYSGPENNFHAPELGYHPKLEWITCEEGNQLLRHDNDYIIVMDKHATSHKFTTQHQELKLEHPKHLIGKLSTDSIELKPESCQSILHIDTMESEIPYIRPTPKAIKTDELDNYLEKSIVCIDNHQNHYSGTLLTVKPNYVIIKDESGVDWTIRQHKTSFYLPKSE